MLVDLIEEMRSSLVMSVNPGFGGQAIHRARAASRSPKCARSSTRVIRRATSKSTAASARENIERAVRAGATMLVAGSSIFGAPDPPASNARACDTRRARGRARDRRRLIARAARSLIAVARRVAAPRANRVVGIGDDAAVWQPSRSHLSVITTDALIEGVHFTRDRDERQRRRPSRAGVESVGHRGDGCAAGARDDRLRDRRTQRRGVDSGLYRGLAALAVARSARSPAATSCARRRSRMSITVVGRSARVEHANVRSGGRARRRGRGDGTPRRQPRRACTSRRTAAICRTIRRRRGAARVPHAGAALSRRPLARGVGQRARDDGSHPTGCRPTSRAWREPSDCGARHRSGSGSPRSARRRRPPRATTPKDYAPRRRRRFRITGRRGAASVRTLGEPVLNAHFGAALLRVGVARSRRAGGAASRPSHGLGRAARFGRRRPVAGP